MAISQIPEIETPIKTLASDNAAGTHPRILEALTACNPGHQMPYGADDYSKAAQAMFENLFGRRLGMFFAFNGTGANILALSGMLNRCDAVICAQTAHLVDDETGAPEAILGAKLVTVPTPDGKLTPELIRPCLAAKGNFHHAQPRVVAIAQLTEVGTLYTPDEVRALGGFCHENGLYLFMDGARLSNAVTSLNVPVKSVTSDAGVDVLVFGGTKNGCAFGEAVLGFNPELEARYPVLRKGAGQLASKMRYMWARASTWKMPGAPMPRPSAWPRGWKRWRAFPFCIRFRATRFFSPCPKAGSSPCSPLCILTSWARACAGW